MELTAVSLPYLFILANVLLTVSGQLFDFDAYDLGESSGVYPQLNSRQLYPEYQYQRNRFPTRSSNPYRSAQMYPPIYKPEDLFPAGFQANYAYKPNRFMPKNPAMGFGPGRFRLQGAEAIVDEMQNDHDAIVVKKTSGSNPPPLPIGFDKLRSSRMDYEYDEDFIPQRRTFGLIANGLNNLMNNGRNGEVDMESDLATQLELQRERERMADLRYQTQLDQMRNRQQIDQLRSELRTNNQRDRYVDNWDRYSDRHYDSYDVERERQREIELQRNLDTIRDNYERDQIENEFRLSREQDEMTTNDLLTSTKLAKLKYSVKPKLTTKTRFSIKYPILG